PALVERLFELPQPRLLLRGGDLASGKPRPKPMLLVDELLDSPQHARVIHAPSLTEAPAFSPGFSEIAGASRAGRRRERAAARARRGLGAVAPRPLDTPLACGPALAG